MRVKIAMPVAYLTPPFATQGKTSETEFSNDMELTAMICASETEHKVSKVPEYAKKLNFVSKLHYPIWAISWGKNCLLLGGMKSVTDIIPLLKPRP